MYCGAYEDNEVFFSCGFPKSVNRILCVRSGVQYDKKTRTIQKQKSKKDSEKRKELFSLLKEFADCRNLCKEGFDICISRHCLSLFRNINAGCRNTRRTATDKVHNQGTEGFRFFDSFKGNLRGSVTA